MKKLFVTDTTLKLLSKERTQSLLFREKTAIASCADSLGADAVELSYINDIRIDSIIYKTVAQNVKNATIVVPCASSEEGIKAAYECVKTASSFRLLIELPVSTMQMEYTYHLKAEKMLEKIVSLIKSAKLLTSDVEFSALDATRADVDFLIRVAKEAENAGASMITISDEAGEVLPETIGELVKAVKEAVGIPVCVNVSDRLGFGLSSAFCAIRNGADGIKTAMSGKDALLMGKLSDAVNAFEKELGVSVLLDKTRVHSSIFELISGLSREEASANTVSDKKKILLDTNSTVKDVEDAARVLGYDLNDNDLTSVRAAMLQVCEKKGAVGRKEFEALIAGYAMQAPSVYHFEGYTTTCSSASKSMSQITLSRGEEAVCGVSIGDGPIDSAFRAIEQCIGHHYELDDFQVQAVTEGKEALGSALVKLRSGGKLYSGNGISTDIVAASIRAYINALNKIVSEEAKQ